MENTYKVVDGVTLDAYLLEAAEQGVSGRGDGRISLADAKEIFRRIKEDDAYTDIEKVTISYIRERYKWTDEADEWFRQQVRRWAAARN